MYFFVTICLNAVTQRDYRANGTEACFILQKNHWGLIVAVYDVIIPIVHVSLTLDDVTSFLRIISLRITCKTHD